MPCLFFQIIGQGFVPCDESMMYKVEIKLNIIDNVVIDYVITISANNDNTYKDDSYVELKLFQISGTPKKWELVEGDWSLRYGESKFTDKEISLIYTKGTFNSKLSLCPTA